MEIKGKVHCFFEQSGTFKNEFIKLGIPAEDYDIQNNFGQTDRVTDLFKEIEYAYDGKPSLFDAVTKDDLIMAFFPCIKFCNIAEYNQRSAQEKWRKIGVLSKCVSKWCFGFGLGEMSRKCRFYKGFVDRTDMPFPAIEHLF